MMQFEKKFTTFNEPLIHLVIKDEFEFYELVKQKCKNDFKYILINGNSCNDIQSLFHEFAVKMRFPDYFSLNWNSFDECINDLTWFDAKGYVVFISHIDKVLLEGNEEFEVLMRILFDTCAEWKQGREYGAFVTVPTPFHIVLQCNPKKEKDIIRRLKRTVVREFDLIK